MANSAAHTLSASSFTAGLAGFVIVGGITLFSTDPLAGMILASLPCALISVFFETEDNALNFVPYFVAAMLLLVMYSIIYYALVKECGISPRRAVVILSIIVAVVSMSVFWCKR